VSDPPLNQVVSRTWQAGLRGTATALDGHLDWRLGAYRSDNDDDIVGLASAIQGRGSYANVPRTRRQGLEAEINFKAERWMRENCLVAIACKTGDGTSGLKDDDAFAAMRKEKSATRPSALTRRMRAMERVKEAIAVAPSHKWSVERLARLANLSPFHLCHVFRQMVGTSIYDYVLQERLAQSLDAVLDGDDNLTAIALDAGFASHSHFTARFRGFFGCTPAHLRRTATAAGLAEFRKIVTARTH
jgi:AraC-like DNA-binding protein